MNEVNYKINVSVGIAAAGVGAFLMYKSLTKLNQSQNKNENYTNCLIGAVSLIAGILLIKSKNK